MKRTLILAAGAILLSACAGAPKPTPAQVVSTTCHALPIVDLTFRVFAPALKLTQEQIGWEVGVVAVATAACKTQGKGWEETVSAGLLAISDFLTSNGVSPAVPPAVAP